MQTQHILTLSCLAIFVAGMGVRTQAAPTAPPRVEITARRFAFEPDAVTFKEGKTVLLVLKSVDVTHGLRIRALGLDLKASKGKPGEVLFTPRKVGDFVGRCSVFCGAKHGTMKITFHVVK